MEPVWNGRASDKIVRELNKIFETLNLPYRAKVEGKPECYDTPRYGWVCSWDYLPVYITNKNDDKIPAHLEIIWDNYHEESDFGTVFGVGKGRGMLLLPDVTIEFDVEMYMIDYFYSYEFKNPRIIKNK